MTAGVLVDPEAGGTIAAGDGLASGWADAVDLTFAAFVVLTLLILAGADEVVDEEAAGGGETAGAGLDALLHSSAVMGGPMILA